MAAEWLLLAHLDEQVDPLAKPPPPERELLRRITKELTRGNARFGSCCFVHAFPDIRETATHTH